MRTVSKGLGRGKARVVGGGSLSYPGLCELAIVLELEASALERSDVSEQEAGFDLPG